MTWVWVLVVILGAGAGAFAGYTYRKQATETKIGRTEEYARHLYDDAVRKADEYKKEKVLEAIQTDGKYILAYRLLLNGEIQPIVLKIVPFHDGRTEKLLASVRKWKERA